ncbi:MAG: HPF/RaiA family ribosome-associated protein [Gemmatimonadaceae bacterium]|nr:HPF/RaiA family ribosome-associated protein [Gemmatimonadaceae bacterium]
MEIIFHAHHAVVPEALRQRAERAVRKLARRFSRIVDAIVRFEADGPVRRVEIVLRAPRSRRFVALGVDRAYGPALAVAAARMEAQVTRVKRTPKSRGAGVARM